ncbi:MAG: DinB family protein [Gemmatimonadota bacterium]
MERPTPDRIPPGYEGYIALVPEGDVIRTLEAQIEDTLSLLRQVPADREDFRYREGAWSIREVMVHVADTERVMAYRALSFGRGDPTPLPLMDQDLWMADLDLGERTLADIAEEFQAVRAATLHLFRSLGEDAASREGPVGDNTFSIATLAWMIAGHELHHRSLLEERYLAEPAP